MNSPENDAENAAEELVWYACYGSNLSYERFICYLEGGKAPGCQKKNKGARNPAEPSDERAVFLPHALYFSQRSIAWQKGGVAFIDPRKNESVQTWARAYLITREQFEDIFMQENVCDNVDINWQMLLQQEALTIGESWYNRILKTGELEGKPILTFTHEKNPEERGYNQPSDKYLKRIIDGLHETYCIGKEGCKKYLRDIPGIKGKIKPGQIAKIWEAVINDKESDAQQQDQN